MLVCSDDDPIVYQDLPYVGRATTISGTQYCQLDFNGRVDTVDPVRTASAVTNACGRVCFTLEAPDSLAVPTFTFWAEGMDIDTVIDISPNGSIQGTLANLSVQSMREADIQCRRGRGQLSRLRGEVPLVKLVPPINRLSLRILGT